MKLARYHTGDAPTRLGLRMRLTVNGEQGLGAIENKVVAAR